MIKAWLDAATKNLRCAKILFEHDGGNEVVAFHCQQAIEKALKALILYLYASLESRHGLLYLCKKVVEKNNEFSKYLDGCAFVNEYYIETRYPNENPLTVLCEDV